MLCFITCYFPYRRYSSCTLLCRRESEIKMLSIHPGQSCRHAVLHHKYLKEDWKRNKQMTMPHYPHKKNRKNDSCTDRTDSLNSKSG